VVARWLMVIGLTLDVGGAAYASWAVILDEDQAINVGLWRVSSDVSAENLELPMVANLIQQSRHAATGLGLVALGFVCQIVAVLLTRPSLRIGRRRRDQADDRDGMMRGVFE
jgi:hypothetical protein